jgi:hypothetical protein
LSILFFLSSSSHILILSFYPSFPISSTIPPILPFFPYNPPSQYSFYTCRYLHILIYILLQFLSQSFPIPPRQDTHL